VKGRTVGVGNLLTSLTGKNVRRVTGTASVWGVNAHSVVIFHSARTLLHHIRVPMRTDGRQLIHSWFQI
jgi:hypothetical protein